MAKEEGISEGCTEKHFGDGGVVATVWNILSYFSGDIRHRFRPACVQRQVVDQFINSMSSEVWRLLEVAITLRYSLQSTG